MIHLLARISSSLVLLPLAVLLASPATAGDEATTIRIGRAFRVVCHFDGEQAAEQALASVEAVWPIACEHYGARLSRPAEPLGVHLYCTIADYEAAADRIAGGKFKRNLAFDRVLAGLGRLEGGEDFTLRLYDRVVRAVAPRGVAELDADFRAWVAGLDPAWDETFRSLAVDDERWVQAAFANANAIAWRTAPVDAPDYEISGRLEILPGPGRQMNVLLDRTPDGFVSVAFHAGGTVTVFEYDAGRDAWHRCARVGCPALETGGEVGFVLGVRDGTLSVRVEGEETCRIAIEGRTWTGAFGLGAQEGTAGIWREIRLVPDAREDAARPPGPGSGGEGEGR